MTTYQGDINTRFIAEYIVNEERSFGSNLEFVTVGMAFQVDWTTIPRRSLHSQSQSLRRRAGGSVQVRPHVGAADVLFTVGGQNDIAAIYPNISLYIIGTNMERA
jgi:hypothetical protein